MDRLQSCHQLRLPAEPRRLHPQGWQGGSGGRSLHRPRDESGGQQGRGHGPPEHRGRRQEERGDPESQQQHHQDHPVQGREEREDLDLTVTV